MVGYFDLLTQYNVNSYHAVMLSRIFNFQETAKDCDIDETAYRVTKNEELFQKQDIQVAK